MYRTDAEGRIISASRVLHRENGVRNSTHQRKVGGVIELLVIPL